MGDTPDDTWAKVLEDRQSSTASPAAQAQANLLAAAAKRWQPFLVVHTSTDAIVFTRPDVSYPWPEEVRVEWKDGIFEFQLRRKTLLVTADRCRQAHAGAVLDAFLLQLDRDTPD